MLLLLIGTTPVAIDIVPVKCINIQKSDRSLSEISDSQIKKTINNENSITVENEYVTLNERYSPDQTEEASAIIPMFPRSTDNPLRGSDYADVIEPISLDNGYVTHDPIQIFSDEDFDTQGWPGTGDLGDPYIISGLEITTPGDGRDCIEIHHTRAYFRITGCHLIGGEFAGMIFAQNGIRLYNVSNGQIWGNEIHNHGESGISVENSSYCDIDGNYCYDNYWGGVGLYKSFYNNVTDNTCAIENQHGIVLTQSGNNIVRGNDATSPGYAGIFIRNCLNGENKISFNTLPGNEHGIAIVYSTYNDVFNNTCNNNDISGIYLGKWEYWKTPSFNLIANNTCNNNVNSGIKIVDTSHSNTVVNNTCSNNVKGIHLNNAYYNTLRANDIGNNDILIHVKDGSGNILEKNTGTGAGNGIHIETSNDNMVINSYCHDLVCGILVEDADNNTIDMNDFVDNEYGVYANFSIALNITNSHFTGNNYGILLEDSPHNCTIEYNNCSFNSKGMKVESHYGIIANNLCANNTGIGINLGSAEHTEVFNNICSNNTGRGIYAAYCEYCNIWDNECKNNQNTGIELGAFSSHSNVIDNLCENNPIGIFLDLADRHLIANNTCRFGDIGIKLDYAWLNHIENNICNNFTVGIQLIDESRQPTIRENTIQHNEYGLEIRANSYTGTVERNFFSDNDLAFYLKKSNNYKIAENEINDCDEGLLVENANNTNVYDNCFTDCSTYGILLYYLITATLTNNTISIAETGLALSNANSTTIGNNTISDSVHGLIFYENSSENMYHWNIYEDNSNAAVDNGTDNDATYNYWSEYGGVDANADGFGDTPYTIPGSAGNQDMYPLVYRPTIPVWIDTLADCTIECGECFSLDANASASTTIRWWISDEANFDIDSDGVITNSTFLPYNVYPLEIRAYNLYNASCAVEIDVIIDDTTIPTISHPNDMTYATDVGLTISWTVYDLNPDRVNFGYDQWIADWFDWEDKHETFTIQLAEYYLGVGVYNISLTAIDTAGNNVTDFVLLTLTGETTSSTTTTTTTTGTLTDGEIPDIMMLTLLLGVGVIAVVIIVIIAKRKT